MKNIQQQSAPLHLENSVNSFAKSDLKLPQAFKTYRTMLDNEYIGAGINLIQNLVNKLDYGIELKDKDKATKEEIKLVEALNSSLNDLRGLNKTQFLNYILSMISYGNSLFEIVMKREDGRIVFDTFSPIHPINVLKYTYDRNTLSKIELTPAENDGDLIEKDTTNTTLKGDKVLMFLNNADLDNPLGRSILKRCYNPWKKLDIVGEYELIGIAKNLSGVLKIKAPSDYIQDYYTNPTSDNARYMDELITQANLLHAGKTSSVVIPSNVMTGGANQAEFDITTIGNTSSNDMDTNAIIGRLENSILTTLYTDILSLGQSGGGSFALSDSKTNILALVIESIMTTISREFGKAIKQAYELNNIKAKGKPYLKFDNVENLDLDAFTRGMQRLIDSNVLVADDKLEEHVRERLGLPLSDKETQRENTGVVVDQNERKEKEK
jgi:hypothetical protein